VLHVRNASEEDEDRENGQDLCDEEKLVYSARSVRSSEQALYAALQTQQA
jgi:hypothetical protein